ncbi:hypothetical protein EPUS_05466 [Endocarpon pusillum Z07020]|uniref:Uncharacterized protein n=1 Tax=Endocarpon pusillum (strain Z07020 / HMAS-L-300199) TaxID=1263415 RepID=U1FYC4_ENDPU|nr:uncharacterized protein EPUS_05466 [Endocarpon pusillum Z07020]ERF69922.1 hypothetical protein EPUS_05466 [Endocarpon pusillum Z07020]
MAETNTKPLGSANLKPLCGFTFNKDPTKGVKSKASKTSSALLADVDFERKNTPQPRLPPNHKIQKRPITHPPIAAPYAGPDVQKVVYVSKHTPIMAAVKRVRKLLDQAEKRNLQRKGVLGTGKRTGNIAAAAQTKSRIKQEEVLVKGSGRAIEQAAKVGEWFMRHAEDGGWLVDVRAGSVKVIDDIVEDSSSKVEKVQTVCDEDENTSQFETLRNPAEKDHVHAPKENGDHKLGNGDNPSEGDEHASHVVETAPKQKAPRHKKRKRSMYDADDVPEARTRFIHAVEIAVSLKG